MEIKRADWLGGERLLLNQIDRSHHANRFVLSLFNPLGWIVIFPNIELNNPFMSLDDTLNDRLNPFEKVVFKLELFKSIYLLPCRFRPW